MNKDRGIIKWAPFNPLTQQKEMIDNLIKEKQKIKKPLLSLEQQKEIEDKIIEAFYEQINVEITYFKSGYIFKITSLITNIDYTFKKIYLNKQKKLVFNQILNINFL